MGAGVALGWPMGAVGGGLLVVGLVYALRRYVFAWEFLLFAVVGMIMFVPGRYYALPISIGIELEPYRVLWVVAVGIVLWAVFVSKTLTWRPIAFGWGIAAYLVCALISFIVNTPSLTEQSLVSNAISAFLSFVILLVPLVVIRQLLTSETLVRRLLVVLVWSGVAIAFLAVFEYITRINVFRLYSEFLPLNVLAEGLEASTTTGAFRSFGSAQHPIALAVMLCTLLPVAVWLAEHASWPANPINRRIVYALAMVAIFGGIMAAISRTAVVVLGAMGLLTLILRPKLGGMLLVASTPVLILLALVRPKMFESTFLSFLDPESLIASQYTSPGWAGQGRLADLDPALEIVAQQPFFGTGLGSRIVVGDNANSFILDNQWLGTLMDLGVLGVIGLAVFMLVPIVKLLRYAFRDALEPRFAQLAFAIAIATFGYAVAMYLFDAFSFVQSFFVLALQWAVGAWLLSETPLRNSSSVAKVTS